MKKYFFYMLIFGVYLFIACSAKPPVKPVEKEPYLEKIVDYRLSVKEPSGLSFSVDGKYLWTVSDRTNKVYKLSLTGATIKSLSYTGNDLEGIVQSPIDSTIWVAEEYLSYMIQLDTLGNVLDSVYIVGAGGSNGLEGITINSSDSSFFLLKEQNNGKLIELDAEFDLLMYKGIGFAGDFSGVTYEPQSQHLWIVSDQDEKVFECDLDGLVLREFEIDVKKAEGIAVNIEDNRIYIVSDSYERLYIFQLIEK